MYIHEPIDTDTAALAKLQVSKGASTLANKILFKSYSVHVQASTLGKICKMNSICIAFLKPTWLVV